MITITITTTITTIYHHHDHHHVHHHDHHHVYLVTTLTEYSTPGSRWIASSRRRLDSNSDMLSKPLPLRMNMLMATVKMNNNHDDYENYDGNMKCDYMIMMMMPHR